LIGRVGQIQVRVPVMGNESWVTTFPWRHRRSLFEFERPPCPWMSRCILVIGKAARKRDEGVVESARGLESRGALREFQQSLMMVTSPPKDCYKKPPLRQEVFRHGKTVAALCRDAIDVYKELDCARPVEDTEPREYSLKGVRTMARKLS